MLQTHPKRTEIDTLARHFHRIVTGLGITALVVLPLFLALKFGGVLA